MRAMLTATMQADPRHEEISDEQADLISDLLVEAVNKGPTYMVNVTSRLLMFTAGMFTTMIDLLPGDNNRDELIAEMMLKMTTTDETEDLF